MKRLSIRLTAVLLLCSAILPTAALAGGGPETPLVWESPAITETWTSPRPEATSAPAESEQPGAQPQEEETHGISAGDISFDKTSNKQFITVQDRAGNPFYLVIDYDAPVNEKEELYQTYFLNPVDASDLAALAQDGSTTPLACTCTEKCTAGAIHTDCPLCAVDMTECAGLEPEPTPTPTPTPEPQPSETPKPEPASGGMNPIVAVVVLAVAAVGGAAAYFKCFRQKQTQSTSPDPDDPEIEEIPEEEDTATEESEDTLK